MEGPALQLSNTQHTVEAAHNHRMTQSGVIAPAISNMPIFVKE